MQTICNSLQTDNHTNASSLNFYRPKALSDAQSTMSKHWRQKHWRQTVQTSTTNQSNGVRALWLTDICASRHNPSTVDKCDPQARLMTSFVTTRRYASAVYAIGLCLSVSDVTSRCSTKTLHTVNELPQVTHYISKTVPPEDHPLFRIAFRSNDMGLIFTKFGTIMNDNVVPSVLWRCWLGGRKGIQPIKNWVVGYWHGYLSGARCRLAYGPADATATHCLLLQ